MNSESNPTSTKSIGAISVQSTNQILMIRPAHFGYNAETAHCNSFQAQVDLNPDLLQDQALKEFDEMVSTIRAFGVRVLVADDTALPEKPDAVFPNNWVSFHRKGIMVLHPMKARNRRWERRESLISCMQKTFQIKQLVDLSKREEQGLYLEGTGSLVLDRVNRIAYAAISPRTHLKPLREFCELLDYELISFETLDCKGEAIYHTNVLLSIGARFAVICDKLIAHKSERDRVMDRLHQSGKTIILISEEQVKHYCGNVLELRSCGDKPILVLSKTSLDAFNELQLGQLNRFVELCPVNIHTIEKVGGGSARCMITEIF